MLFCYRHTGIIDIDTDDVSIFIGSQTHHINANLRNNRIMVTQRQRFQIQLKYRDNRIHIFHSLLQHAIRVTHCQNLIEKLVKILLTRFGLFNTQRTVLRTEIQNEHW